MTASVGGDSSLRCFSRRLLQGHSIAHAALDDATIDSHFTSSPNFLSPSVPSFVYPGVSVSGLVVRPRISCWLKHGHPENERPQRIGPPGR